MARYILVCACVVSLARVSQPQVSVTSPPALSPAPAPAVTAGGGGGGGGSSSEEPPEGYYAFVESPNATPPRVRPPPYRQSGAECGGARASRPHVSADNLCGDLNRGDIPRNPMGHRHYGEPYPFEVIRNQTLRFLSRTLPVLRHDDTLPRVAHLQPAPAPAPAPAPPRTARAAPAPAPAPEDARDGRKFCDGGGVFCMLYRAINGDSSPAVPAAGVERREDPGPSHQPSPHRYEGPPTPCPARVEYATPVFARNYQGVWRYVVQIPYEGYFTQTIEVTRCMQSRCHYLDGGCLSSPRWVSLLVAEIHYPDVLLSADSAPHSPHSPQSSTAPHAAPPALNDLQNYQQYLQKRAGRSTRSVNSAPSAPGAPAGPGAPDRDDKTHHCDGHDDLGCYQVRLYYDWFLVPGSCKCWRPDYFARYVRRAAHSGDL